MTVPHAALSWRKSSRSTASDTCVEVAYTGWLRDSKNPAGGALSVSLDALLAATKAGKLDR